MKRLQKKSISAREETFALALCGCSCLCDCIDSCDCPIAPTHQIGLNAQVSINPKEKSRHSDYDYSHGIADQMVT